MKKYLAVLAAALALVSPAALGQPAVGQGVAGQAAVGQPAANRAVPGQPAPPVPITVISQSSEYRFQLDFHVSDTALAKLLPAGWVSNAATQGAAKDANVRLIFIDAGNIAGPDNRLASESTDVLAYLAAPVKQADGTAAGQMILGGISLNRPETAFGVMEKASDAKVTRTMATANSITLVTEDWDLTSASGAHAMLHVQYTRVPANRANATTNFYNPADPTKFEIFKTEQATDITRNVTTNPPDRVMEFSYKASGGKFAALFDGTEKALSWDSQPIYNRIVGTPAKP